MHHILTWIGSIIVVMGLLNAMAWAQGNRTCDDGYGAEICGFMTCFFSLAPRHKSELGAMVRHEGAFAVCSISSNTMKERNTRFTWQVCDVSLPHVAGHRLKFRLARRAEKVSWFIRLIPPAPVDISKGIALKVDKGENRRIPPDFLSTVLVVVDIREDAARVVMDELRKGRLLSLRYVRKDGKEVNVSFPVRSLMPLLKWAVCMARSIDRVR